MEIVVNLSLGLGFRVWSLGSGLNKDEIVVDLVSTLYYWVESSHIGNARGPAYELCLKTPPEPLSLLPLQERDSLIRSLRECFARCGSFSK